METTGLDARVNKIITIQYQELDRRTGKPRDGSRMPSWYAEKKYDEIERYVRAEAAAFVTFFSWFQEHAPEFLARFRKENGVEPAQKPAPDN